MTRRQSGFTVAEIMIAVAIVAIVVSIAIPAYNGYVTESKNVIAAADINTIEDELKAYFYETRQYPDDLAAIGRATKEDPWGQTYTYYNIAKFGVAGARKDKSLHPLNSDFDLYSIGPDGDSKLALTAKPSYDDVIRASNGRFIGLGKDF